jgi:hypothetical protein
MGNAAQSATRMEDASALFFMVIPELVSGEIGRQQAANC